MQVGKSVEALTLYLDVLRAGFVFMPLNTAYQAAGSAPVFTLGEDDSGSLLDRADAFGDTQQPVPRWFLP